MDTNNQHILNWREHVLKAAEALKNHDYETYEMEIGEMENSYNEMRKDEALSYNDEDTFGAANAMFESALPELYLNNKKAIKEFMTTIKEDKNLSSQFMFYNTLKQYKNEFNKDKYLQEAVSLALEKINPKTIKESNKKLYDIIRKHNIRANDFLNEDDLHFYRLCETIFTNSKSLSNLAKLNETYNQISSLMENRVVENKNEKVETMTVQEFIEKYNKILTENEKDFINTILDSSNEEKRKKLYEDFKNACLQKIETIINESNNEIKSKLNTLSETIASKVYNKNTVLQDIVKIMDVNEILNN